MNNIATLRLTFLCLFINVSTDLRAQNNDCEHPDYGVMLDFARNIQDLAGSLNWDTTECDICVWNRVTCNESGRIKGLNLNGIIRGPIPNSIGQLTFLEDFSFISQTDGNGPTGSIPITIGQLRNLKNLALGVDGRFGSLNGIIPSSIGDLRNLETLYLQSSILGGEIPVEIGNLTKLRTLRIKFTRITGNLPASIGQLTNLEILDVSQNFLSGELPRELGNLAKLKILNLNKFQGQRNSPSNQFTGNIPLELGDLVNVEEIYINAGIISGTLPVELLKLEKLKIFEIQGRITGRPGVFNRGELTGCFDPAFKLWCDREVAVNLIGHLNLPWDGDFTKFCETRLGTEDIDGDGICNGEDCDDNDATIFPGQEEICNGIDNNCDGIIGNPNQDTEALLDFYNAVSGLNWDINNPCRLCTWQGVKCDETGRVIELNLMNIPLLGSIPESIGQLSELTFLNLFNTGIKGNIPPTIGQLKKLRRLWLGFNELEGVIPSELGDLTALEELYLNRNKLKDHIPEALGKLNKLSILSIGENQITGSIPPTLGNLSQLEELILERNQLIGTIPQSFENLNNLRHLNLSENQLSDAIPVLVFELNLFFLNLSNNNFSKALPNTTKEGTDLSRLFLNNNQLSGALPPFFKRINFFQLDLSNNQFSGSIPEEIFTKSNGFELFFHNNKFTGNVPNSIGEDGCVRINLSNNQLAGSIPVNLFKFNEGKNCVRNGFIDLSNNNLSGCFYPELKSLCTILLKTAGNPNLPFNGDFTRFCNNTSLGIQDLDNDGFCNGEDCDDTNPKLITFPCVVNADCNNINITSGNNQISITELEAVNEIIQIFDENYSLIYRCEGQECGEAVVIDELTAGDYIVNVQFYSEQWAFICAKENEVIRVSNGNIKCSNIQIASNDGMLTIENIKAANPIIQVFHSDYSLAYRCQGLDCAEMLTLSDLVKGDYFVNVQLYDANWEFICELPNTLVTLDDSNLNGTDCEILEFATQNNQITISGLTTQSKVEIIGQNTDWQVITVCDGNCADVQTTSDLMAGEYTVKVNLLENNDSYCYREEKVTILEDGCKLEIIGVTYPDTVVPGDIISITATIKNESNTASDLTSLILAQGITYRHRSIGLPQFRNIKSIEIPIIPPNEAREVTMIYETQKTLAKNVFNPWQSQGQGEYFLKFPEELDHCQKPVISSITHLDFYIEYPEVDLSLSLDTDNLCINSDGILQANLVITNIGSVASKNPIYVYFIDCQSANIASKDLYCFSPMLGIAFATSKPLSPGQSDTIYRPFKNRFEGDTIVLTNSRVIPEVSLIEIKELQYQLPDVIFNPDICQENAATANCSTLNFIVDEEQIIIKGLTATYNKVEIIGQNTDWKVIPICDGDCNSNQIISDLDQGEYTVKVNQGGNDGSYCYREEQIFVRNNSSNRNSIIDYGKELSIFPNPANTSITLKFRRELEKEGTIRIYNIFGQMVKSFPKRQFTKDIIPINLEGYENGMYILSIEADNLPIITKRFVVEHLR